MKFRKAFCGGCTDHGVDWRNFRQRYISTDGEGWLVIVGEIARRIIQLRRTFISRRMFVSVIVVVRMHSADRTQILMPAQVGAPRSARHDKRAYEQDQGENAYHEALITNTGGLRKRWNTASIN